MDSFKNIPDAAIGTPVTINGTLPTSPENQEYNPIPLDKLKDDEIKLLINHYSWWAHQAAFSTYEFMINRKHILKINEELINYITTNKRSDEYNIQQNNDCLKSKTDPLNEIRHFTTDVKATTLLSLLKPPDGKRNTRVTLDNKTVEIEIKESFRQDANKQSTFISETILPPTLTTDEICTWARTAITSFLAAAPKNQNKLNFEDGFTSKQLAAACSYCDALGYQYSIGDKQILRIFAAELKTKKPPELTDEQWKKLENNEVVDIDPKVCQDLANKITEDQRKKWIDDHTTEFEPNKWQKWMDQQREKNLTDMRFPVLVETKREHLLFKKSSEKEIYYNPESKARLTEKEEEEEEEEEKKDQFKSMGVEDEAKVEDTTEVEDEAEENEYPTLHTKKGGVI